MSKDKFVILDGNSILFRAYYALPPLKNKKGVFTNAVYGFLTMLYKIIDDYQPNYICVAFDPDKPTFRHEKYEDYKAGRAKAPNELVMQFGMIRDVLDKHNIKYLEIDSYEADDIAGSLANKYKGKDIETYLVTSDKDYLQLIDKGVTVILTKTGVTNIVEYNEEKMEEEYGITPEQFIDLKALMGDSSDNIPGVYGIGEKTGLKLLKKYGSLDGVYENIDEIKGKMKEKLEKEKNQAYLSYTLAKIIKNLPLDYDIDYFKYVEADKKELMDLYDEYEFRKLKDRFKESAQLTFGTDNIEIKDKEKILEEIPEAIEIETKELKKKILKEKTFGFKFLYDYERVFYSKIVYAGFIIDDDIYYLKKDLDKSLKELKDIFEEKNIKKQSHHIKDELIYLLKLGINLKGIEFDTMIGKYILDPSERSYDIDRLAYEFLEMDIHGEAHYLGKGKKKKSFAEIKEDQGIKYLSELLYITKNVKNKIEQKIKESKMEDLYQNFELPLVKVMASMEVLGFKIDKEELNNIGNKLKKKLEILEEIIQDFAGEEFNLNSPKQLGEILFEKMDLPVVKKTKTGYSTDAEVLEKLKSKHPIIDKIIDYRQLSKLNSTYVEGFLKLIDENDGRVHSSFKQTITSTGRISSTEPNLQNIPVRTEEGRELRKVFVPENNEYILLDADYSQIELRVLAHVANETKLIEAFEAGEDIHTKTASEVFRVPMEEVTSLMRSRAKAVNFGIVYGISDYGLSRDLGISRKEAKEYIDNYLDYYSNINKYMKDIIKKGKKEGYVETVFGRRRDLPELKSRNYNVRSFGERLALNTPIQGTAADIIKKAMINVFERLDDEKLKSRLILQVHDELILEVYKPELENVKNILKEEMENAAKLKINLAVDMNTGGSWYEAK
ncbi:MAG TPA: DNA polymerase I [Clostridiales bacterium]|nr:DNA polymerase I [Clostridiales bacterium]